MRRVSPIRNCALLVTLSLPLLLAACSSERRYDVRGRVAGFGDDGRTVFVEHEAIPGLMPAMTMPFELADSAAAETLEAGEAISFELVLRGERSWVEGLVGLPDGELPQHPAGRPDPFQTGTPPLLESGDPVPDAQLVTHADTTLRPSELRGRRVLLTFIYTECPVPDFCPLMSRQFAQLQSTLRRVPGAPVHLLSVSFDPETDTPAVLRDYAARYTDDLSNWTFASGDASTIGGFAARFGVFYQGEDDQVLHNLVTVLIDEEGIIRRIWRGNDWRPDDVRSALASR